MQTICLTRGNIAALTATAVPTGAPPFSDAGIVDVWVHQPWGWPLSNNPITVDAYNATDWADAAEPAVVDHIMFNPSTKQFKVNRWLVGDFGDMMFANIEIDGHRGPRP